MRERERERERESEGGGGRGGETDRGRQTVRQSQGDTDRERGGREEGVEGQNIVACCWRGVSVNSNIQQHQNVHTLFTLILFTNGLPYQN